MQGNAGRSSSAAFQNAALAMKDLCCNPPAPPSPQLPEHRTAMRETLGCEDLRSAETAMRDVAVAPKLAALRDLLAQCGIIGGDEEGAGTVWTGEEGRGKEGVGERAKPP